MRHTDSRLRFSTACLATALALSCAGTARVTPDSIAIAQSHIDSGNGVSAVATLEAGGARDGRDPVASCLLGGLYRDRGTIQGRLRSQEVLEAARARHPGDLNVTMELARTYFAQGFYPDAVRYTRAVLARDPQRCDAYALLGLYHYQNWMRMNEYTDDLVDARRGLRAAAACDPDNAEIAVRCLVAGYVLGDSIGAECDEFIVRFPERPEFRMMRGTLAFEAGRYEACARDYAAGVGLMDEATATAYRSMVHVLAAGDDGRYRSATSEMRDDFQRGYWLVADPDATTEVNPRALEHVYRMFVADCRYANSPTGKRGWETDRGEAFLRFGAPVDIDYIMGEGFMNGKIETWSFVTEGSFHQLVFVDEFLNGNPRIPYEADFTLHYMRHTPAITALPADAVPLPNVVDAYAFRDDPMHSSIYVAMAIDSDALRNSLDVNDAGMFVLRGAYFNPMWQREGGFSDSVRASALHETRSARGRSLAWVRQLRVPSDRYHLAVAFEDATAVTRATGRRDADAARFASDRLGLSDVLLFRGEHSQADDIAIERNGARMRPNIERLVAHGERLRAYVEVYNLALASREGARASSYDLRYAIFPARTETDPAWVDWGRRAAEWAGFGDDEDAMISQTFRREGRAHDDRESIAIDVDVLDDGRYQLLIEVTDRESGQRAAVHAPFWKESGRVADR